MIKEYLGIAMADLSSEYRDSLEKRIYKYFPPIEVDIRFADALTADAYGLTQFDLGETWKTWVEIPFEVFEQGCQDALYFLDEAEIAMLTPRYLIEMISRLNLNDPIETALSIMEKKVGDWIVAEVLFKIFHPEQIQIIIECIYFDIKCVPFIGTYDSYDRFLKLGESLDIIDYGRATNISNAFDFWSVEKNRNKIKSWVDFDITKNCIWKNQNPGRMILQNNIEDSKSIENRIYKYFPSIELNFHFEDALNKTLIIKMSLNGKWEEYIILVEKKTGLKKMKEFEKIEKGK